MDRDARIIKHIIEHIEKLATDTLAMLIQKKKGLILNFFLPFLSSLP